MTKLIRSLYDWTLRLAAHKHATWWLAIVSFVESSVFPIPPDVVLIPMCIAERDKAFRYATICTASSVVGGMLGYFIGHSLYETVGLRIIEFYGMAEKFNVLQAKYAVWGGWIIFAKGMTPIPYKIITILSGVLHLPLLRSSTGVKRRSDHPWLLPRSGRSFVTHHTSINRLASGAKLKPATTRCW